MTRVNLQKDDILLGERVTNGVLLGSEPQA